MPRIRIFVVLIALSPLLFAQEPDWNQWRGPNRDGSVAATLLPRGLQGKVSLAWEHPQSPSYSGPIVCDGLVITTETIDKTIERVVAYRLNSGDLVWSRQWPGAMAVPFFAAANGDWIRSTPACDGANLLIMGMKDVLVCMDSRTGNEKWRVDFPADFGTPLPSFGAVCSPLIDGDAVFVQTGGAVVKLSLQDGRKIWSTLENGKGMMESGAFSSPVIAKLGGLRQLVVQTRKELCGVDLNSGLVLWREPIEAFRGMNILTPLIFGKDQIFTSAHSGKAQLFQVTRSSGASFQITELWSQKTQAYMSSPVLMGDSVYLHLKNQRVTSLAIADGAIRWTSSPQEKYWSMICDGQKMLTLDNTGWLKLIGASPEKLQVIDEMRVAEDSWAHLAISGNRIIVRDLNAIKVFEFER